MKVIEIGPWSENPFYARIVIEDYERRGFWMRKHMVTVAYIGRENYWRSESNGRFSMNPSFDRFLEGHWWLYDKRTKGGSSEQKR